MAPVTIGTFLVKKTPGRDGVEEQRYDRDNFTKGRVVSYLGRKTEQPLFGKLLLSNIRAPRSSAEEKWV